jgi:hypothetical protein
MKNSNLVSSVLNASGVSFFSLYLTLETKELWDGVLGKEGGKAAKDLETLNTDIIQIGFAQQRCDLCALY